MKNNSAAEVQADEQKKRRIQVITVAATILLLFMVIGLIVNLVSLFQLSARKTELDAQLKDLVASNNLSEDIIAYRKTDDYIGRYAREQLGLVRDDETAFVLEDK